MSKFFLGREKFILLLIFFLVFLKYFLIQIPIFQEITPDSKLYMGLAENLMNGKGYYDTIRNDEILPPIGHPFLLFLFFSLKQPSYFDNILVYLSFLLIGLAVWKYTNKLSLVVFSSFFMFLILKQIGFYKFGIETSGFFTSSLLIYFLVRLFKNKFSFLNIFWATVSLTINILVRPTLLYLAILAIVLLFGYLFYLIKKNKFKRELFQYKLFITFLFSLLIILIVSIYSSCVYKDSRLVRGTYAAMNLYLSNNIYLPPDKKYRTNYFNDYMPNEEKQLVLSNSAGWKKRESILFSKALDYIKHNPIRASQGWWWRLERYLGKDYSFGNDLFIYKVLIKLTIILLFFQLVLYFLLRKIKFDRNIYLLSLIITLLLMFQIFQLIFFSWTGERYLIYLIPYLIVASFFLINDCGLLLKKALDKF